MLTSTRARVVPVILIVWLIIGAIAAGQRHYYSSNSSNGCATLSTILVTVVAGPLNYVGINPKIHNCTVPAPSK